ncbi:MAG: iron ABC transporter permease [Clostridia bacterium]|nr:iron ABC transporter permease [Clostridia bacterium]
MLAMKKHSLFLLFALPITAAVMLFCVCVGSVAVPLGDTLTALWSGLTGVEGPGGAMESIILDVRLPRVLAAALVGASLSLCGACMQGLLRNPLADGSTLGVSSGASLGAAFAILIGFQLPGLPLTGTALMAMGFAFVSLVTILSLAFSLDRSLSTHTIILLGIVFAMLVSALLSLLIVFSGEKLRTITFWTMGSLSSVGYPGVALLSVSLAVSCALLLPQATALDAFALGEDTALHLGVSVRRVKLLVLATVSALIGVCVSVGGCIGFVGLVTPHMARLLVGPGHRRLLPASLFGGAWFLMLTDLASRALIPRVQLPIGAVTSIIGSALFVWIFARSSRKEAA